MAKQTKQSNANPNFSKRELPRNNEIKHQHTTSNPSTLDKLNQLEHEEIEDEIGLEEMDVDMEELDAIAADDIHHDENWEDDEFETHSDDEELISDLPQEQTQSYGTGLQGKPIDRTGRRDRSYPDRSLNAADQVLTGGDVDANYEQANAVGDESVGGTVATPDQDVVDELGAAVGLEVDDRSFLRTKDTLEERDDRRWELDPKSSDDYQERRS